MTAATAARPLFECGFEELEVGQRHVTERRTITQDDLLRFAHLTGDDHPLHVDPEWAGEQHFGGPTAHGLLVLSCAAGLLPLDPDLFIALRRVTEVTFKRPVLAGGTIHVVATVDKLLVDEDWYGVARLRLGVRGERDELLAGCALDIVWRRREVLCRLEL